MDTWKLYLAILGCACLILGSAYSLLRVLINIYKSRQWVPVDCRIDGVVTNYQGWAIAASGFGAGDRKHNIEANYRYIYEGQEYTGDKVNVLDDVRYFVLNEDNALLNQLKNAVETGEKLQCYVNLKDPRQSYLVKKWYPLRLFFLITILVFSLAGIIWLFGKL